MRKEITNVKALEYVLNNYELPTEIAEKIQNIKTSYEKKNSKVSKKAQANRDINEELEQIVLKVLMNGNGKPETVSGIMKADDTLAGLSNQKVTYLVRSLVEKGMVEKIIIKRVSYFTLNDSNFVEE